MRLILDLTQRFFCSPPLVTPDLISGETNDLKVTFRNTGKTDLKINLIVGSVAEMTDFNTVIRNVRLRNWTFLARVNKGLD